MKNLSLLVLFLIALFAFSRNNQEVKKIDDNPHKKHVVIVLDFSGSTRDWPRPEIDFFESIIEALQREGATLEIYNFSNKVAIPLKLKLKRVPPPPKIDIGEIAYKKAKRLRENIQSQNERSIEAFYLKLEKLNTQDKSKWTYANRTLKRVKKSLASPIYENGYESFCLILSDLKDSVPKQKTAPVDEDTLSSVTDYAHVYICNYDESADLSDTGVSEIEYTDFIEILNNF